MSTKTFLQVMDILFILTVVIFSWVCTCHMLTCTLNTCNVLYIDYISVKLFTKENLEFLSIWHLESESPESMLVPPGRWKVVFSTSLCNPLSPAFSTLLLDSGERDNFNIFFKVLLKYYVSQTSRESFVLPLTCHL